MNNKVECPNCMNYVDAKEGQNRCPACGEFFHKYKDKVVPANG